MSVFSAIFVLKENGTQSHSARFLNWGDNWGDHVNSVPDLAASPPWRYVYAHVFMHTKLYKGAWNVSANNSGLCGPQRPETDLRQIAYILVFYNISFSWLLPLDGFQFIFLLRDSENELYRIYLVYIIAPRQKVNHKTVHKAYLSSKFRRKNRKYQTNFICGRFHQSTEPVVRHFLKLFIILFREMLITVYQI